MARCRSWRPVLDDHTHPIDHAPGSCRACWTVCSAKVPRGQVRCTACERALATHPSASVRMALAREEGTCSRDVLELLAGDLDSMIAHTAGARLSMLGRSGARNDLEEVL
ncbi:hypothetical protein [Isoptericola croceus]|uniref:hypothetical protein n=1 Tax=Isoptericola croceus TaxID=3031406 RepID=UPI0023F9FDD6|nr:hypothetical protein [Isoptericola croceus]